MRGDINNKTDYRARTESEAVDDRTCFGHDIVKIAKYINLVIGVALFAFMIWDFISFKFLNVFATVMRIY